jgi:hypothetical protein
MCELSDDVSRIAGKLVCSSSGCAPKSPILDPFPFSSIYTIRGMSPACSGVRLNGKPCKCLGFVKHETTKKCGTCKHRRSKHQAPTRVQQQPAAHPATLEEIIKKYSSQDTNPANSNLDVARNETVRGFRPQPVPSKVKVRSCFHMY